MLVRSVMGISKGATRILGSVFFRRSSNILDTILALFLQMTQNLSSVLLDDNYVTFKPHFKRLTMYQLRTLALWRSVVQ